MSTAVHVIFNPVSGQGNSEIELEIIKKSLKSLGNVTVHSTTPEQSADVLARQARDQSADILIASGGDGTVSAVASALINTGTPMGIIPRGTVNAFAGAMNIPMSVRPACDVILHQNIKEVDTAWCNDHLMLLLIGIGFEADLMKETNRETKNKFGRLAVFADGLRQLRELDQFQVQVETSSQKFEIDASAVTVANAATVQTILAQGPSDIDASDGLLDVTIVSPKNRWRAVSGAANLFLSAILGEEVNHEDVEFCRSSTVTITAEPEQNVIIDGDWVGTTPITATCLRRSLQVIVPSGE